MNNTVIVIVSYNGCYFMQKNIESIRATVPENTYQIIVVDNASTDGVTDYLRAQEDIILIENDENVGFAPACNQAVEVAEEVGLSDCDIFLLNNDTRLPERALINMSAALHSDEKIGAVGAVSNYAGNKQQLDVEFTLPGEFLEYGKNINNVPIEDIGSTLEERVRLSGFAMLIRAGLWQLTGGMDEDFAPGYFEDDDLCMKIAKCGYKMAVCHAAFIYHAGSQSFAHRDDLDELLIAHHELFIKKYGFDVLNYADAVEDVTAQIPYKHDEAFNMLVVGCGLGADMKAVRYAFPNANIIGVESNESLFDIVSGSEVVVRSIQTLGNMLTNPVFNVLLVASGVYGTLSENDINVISPLCLAGCKVIAAEASVKIPSFSQTENMQPTVDFSKIKLVIWDMDNTFWDGVLSEGRVNANAKNIALVKHLADAGIINSISSKNNEADVLEILSQLGIADLFVFNDINWEDKGPQIKNKLEKMHLREENVLFIDDETRNLEEAKHYCPKIMTLLSSDINELASYADGLQVTDAGHERLSNYRILEEKYVAESASSDKEEFLRNSEIVVEIAPDCLNEEERIAELIARTNQLNFTKVRDTKDVLHEYLLDDSVKKGYIRVKDKYGDYGIAGFYCYEKTSEPGDEGTCDGCLRHFLFSCRIMGMGVPQYIFEILGCPGVSVKEPVAEKLSAEDKSRVIDWISLKYSSDENQDALNKTHVENEGNGSDNSSKGAKARKSNQIRILMKGPCDMSALESYLNGGDITTEFNFVNDRGFITTGQNHSVNIRESFELTKDELKAITDDTDFITMDDFETSIFTKEYDVICYSLLADGHAGLYRNKNTGHFINFGSTNWDLTDPKNESGYIDGSIVNHLYPFDHEKIEHFRTNWEYVGTTPVEDIIDNLEFMYDNAPGTPLFILLLGSEVEYEGENIEFANHALRHIKINKAVRKWAEDKSRVRLINPTDYIHSQQDFEDSTNHYARNVYYDIATDVVKHINKRIFWIKKVKPKLEDKKSLNLIIPTIKKDFERVGSNIPLIFRFLPVKSVTVIGPMEVKELVTALAKATGLTIGFVNEADLIDIKKMKEFFKNRLLKDGYVPGENSRLGWYYQQFLKLEYAKISPDKYYLTWDADTIPLHNIEFFDEEGKPYFDVKPEYMKTYFNTIGTLFDGMQKCIEDSFISEHMVFDKDMVLEMTDLIGSKRAYGDTWYEKLISLMKPEDMIRGFSEFETYGTYVTTRHPGEYNIRKWNSLRTAGYFFDPNKLTEDDIRWLGESFDAATFEGYNMLIPELYEIMNDPSLRNVSASEMYDVVKKSGIFKENSADGSVVNPF